MAEKKKIAKFNLFDNYAHIEFNFRTPPELKEYIKKFPWIKWQKKALDGRTWWYLHADLNGGEGEDRNADLINICREFNIEPVIRFDGEDEFSKNFDYKEVSVGKPEVDPKSEKAQPFRIYLRPSLYSLLSTVAEKKGMSLSQFIIVATDYYIKGEKIDLSKMNLPLKVTGEPLSSFELTTSDQIRMAMARLRTKPAWVADKLGYSRSSFYGKLSSNLWTDEEKEELSRLLKTSFT